MTKPPLAPLPACDFPLGCPSPAACRAAGACAEAAPAVPSPTTREETPADAR